MEHDPNPTAMIRTALLMGRIPEAECSPETLEIASLVQRTLSGDSPAFECIISRYERRVVSLAMKLLGTIEDAQDAAQEVFLRAYKYLHRLDLQKPIEPWLMRMTVNVCRNIGRKRQRRLNTFSESETLDSPATSKSCDPFAGIAEEQESHSWIGSGVVQFLWQWAADWQSAIGVMLCARERNHEICNPTSRLHVCCRCPRGWPATRSARSAVSPD